MKHIRCNENGCYLVRTRLGIWQIAGTAERALEIANRLHRDDYFDDPDYTSADFRYYRDLKRDINTLSCTTIKESLHA